MTNKNFYLFVTTAILTLGLWGCKKVSLSPNSFQKLMSHEESHDLLFPGLNNFELYGQTSGYGSLRTDGIADFGLVLKSFKRTDLFQIELNDLMSTKFDSISIIGNKINIPSNVAIPQQRERYILSINLDKPNYKIDFNPNENQSLVLLHGQFPFEDVVKGFRNDQSLFELADKFSFLSYSEYSFDNQQQIPKFNLNLVAGKNIHNQTIQIQAPSNFNSQFTFIAVAADSTTDEHYLPNNLAVLKPNEARNFKISSNNSQIFSGLIHQSFADPDSNSLLKFKMSLAFQPAQSWNSQILGFIENLKYNSENLDYDLPSNNGLRELGVAFTIVEVDKNKKEQIIHQDYILGAWEKSLDLSKFQIIRQANYTYRLDLFLSATSGSKTARNFDDLFELAEYVTRNSVSL